MLVSCANAQAHKSERVHKKKNRFKRMMVCIGFVCFDTKEDLTPTLSGEAVEGVLAPV